MVEHTPGWKTSEFWMSLLVVVLPMLDAAIQHAPQNAAWAPIAATLVGIAYNWSRAHTKVGVANAAATTAVAQAQAATAQATRAAKPIQGVSLGRTLENVAITQLLPQVLDDNDSTGPQDDEVTK